MRGGAASNDASGRSPGIPPSLLKSGRPLVNAERRTDIYRLTPDADRFPVKLRDGDRLEITRLGAGSRPLRHWRIEVARRSP